MKIQAKIPKLQMHEKLHKNVNENENGKYGGQLKQLYTASNFHSHFYAIFHEFLWWAIKSSFTLLISFYDF